MKKSVIIAVIVAIGFIILGLSIGVIGLFALNFNFNSINMAKIKPEDHIINEPFDSINIAAGTYDVEFLLATDGVCRVVGNVIEDVEYLPIVENGALNIIENDNRKWYQHIGIFWGETGIKVYLPQAEYNLLTVKNDTGDIEIPKNFTFGNINLLTDTGEIEFCATVKGEAIINTDTGDVEIENTSFRRLDIKVDTGDVDIRAVEVSEDIGLETNTGDITLEKAAISGNLNIKTDTGDVELIDSDAKELRIVTDTGDVYGKFLTPKIFITETSTGDIRVPQSLKGGKCHITTDTGDIEMNFKK